MVSLLLVGAPPLRGHLLPTPLHCRVICPSLCPNQEHKAHLAQFLLLERGRADACHAYEHLTRGLGTHRYHQTPTEGQLLLQCCGEPWAASCDYNAVVGRVFRPACRCRDARSHCGPTGGNVRPAAISPNTMFDNMLVAHCTVDDPSTEFPKIASTGNISPDLCHKSASSGHLCRQSASAEM